MPDIMPQNGPVLEYSNSEEYTLSRVTSAFPSSVAQISSEVNERGKNAQKCNDVKSRPENKDYETNEEKKGVFSDLKIKKSQYTGHNDTMISEFIPGPLPEKISSKFSSKQDLIALVQDGSEDLRQSETSSQNGTEDDLRNSDIRALLRKREQQVQKPVNFNIMVAGESGCGKSTFIDAFLNKKYMTNEPIRPSTTEISERVATRDYNGMTLKITFIDTPGYGRSLEITDWYTKIKTYIVNQFVTYKEEKNKKFKEKKVSISSGHNDTRVHILLYFLSGPRINQKDLIFMKKLKKYCSIVPILAKGDSYTISEIKEIKLNLVKEAADFGIEWFDFIEALKDSPQKYKEVSDGKFGPSPPFLIITSLTKVQIAPNEYVYGREYTWGICNIENPEHSDFVLLQALLGGYICLEAINATNYFYKEYFKKLKQKKKSLEDEEQIKKIGVGTLIACGFVGLLVAFKKKLLE